MLNTAVKHKEKKQLIVVAGLLADWQGRYLLSQRQSFQDHPLCWDFPGGKVEANETLQQALVREIFEETDIRIQNCQPFKHIFWDYGDKEVNLHFYLATDYQGQPRGKEGQELAWYLPEKMQQLTVPEANRAIITALHNRATTKI